MELAFAAIDEGKKIVTLSFKFLPLAGINAYAIP